MVCDVLISSFCYFCTFKFTEYNQKLRKFQKGKIIYIELIKYFHSIN